MSTTPLIMIKDLWVSYPNPKSGENIVALEGINLKIGYEKFGLVGESGSGKSTLARAIMGLLPPAATVRAQHFLFDQIALPHLSQRAYRRLRKTRMGMIFQDPSTAFNPIMTVGKQIAEAGHGFPSKRRKAALDMLKKVHIQESKRVYDSYPYQLSGGMRQRAMIAMMLMTAPDLLIADEAVSSLDARLSVEILALLDERFQQHPMGLLFISHNLGLMASFCDRIAIMRNGQIVECLKAERIDHAKHPYTRALLNCVPRLGDTRRRQRFLPVAPALNRKQA